MVATWVSDLGYRLGIQTQLPDGCCLLSIKLHRSLIEANLEPTSPLELAFANAIEIARC